MSENAKERSAADTPWFISPGAADARRRWAAIIATFFVG
jgi:hypothetical protein